MHGEIGMLSPGSVSSLPPPPLLLCAVFSCLHTTGCEAYSFQHDMGSLMCAHIWVRAVRTRRGVRHIYDTVVVTPYRRLHCGESECVLMTQLWRHTAWCLTGVRVRICDNCDAIPHDILRESECVFVTQLWRHTAWCLAGMGVNVQIFF